MRAIVDQVTCIGCGLCQEICPEIFEMDKDVAKVKVVKVPPDTEALCREAMEGCPVGAISVEE